MCFFLCNIFVGCCWFISKHLFRFVNSGLSKGKVFYEQQKKKKQWKILISENVIAFIINNNTSEPNSEISNQIWMVWQFCQNVCNSKCMRIKRKTRNWLPVIEEQIIIITNIQKCRQNSKIDRSDGARSDLLTNFSVLRI